MMMIIKLLKYAIDEYIYVYNTVIYVYKYKLDGYIFTNCHNNLLGARYRTWRAQDMR